MRCDARKATVGQAVPRALRRLTARVYSHVGRTVVTVPYRPGGREPGGHNSPSRVALQPFSPLIAPLPAWLRGDNKRIELTRPNRDGAYQPHRD